MLKYIGNNKELARKSFLKTQKKIVDDYNQETKKSFGNNPNFKKKKWH